MAITTKEYSQSAAKIGRKATVDLLWRWWWALALPLVAAAVASLWDWRWIVAALALALVAYPFMLMMAYYTQVLTPAGALALHRRHLLIDSQGVTIIYQPYDADCPTPQPVHIGMADITEVRDLGSQIEILHSGGVASIPSSAIEPEEYAEILKIFHEKMAICE